MALSVIDPEDRTAYAEKAILDLAESETQIDPSRFRGCAAFDDLGRVLLNTLDCVLRVSATTIEELPHAPEHLFTRQLQVIYNPRLLYPRFQQTLEENLPCVEDQRLKQLCMANIFYPSARFEIALVEIGAAGSGKSTLSEPFLKMLGEGMNTPVVTNLNISQLCDSKTYALVELEFSLANLATELQSLEVADSSNFKTLVSGEPLQVRDIYEKSKIIRPTAKLWFLSNFIPRFKHGSAAELRRMRFLLYQFVVPAEKYDSKLKEAVGLEKDAIFSSWVIPALQDLMGMDQMPQGGDPSLDLRSRFAESNDPLASFLTNRCVLEKDALVPQHRLIDAMRFYYEDQDLPESFGKHPLKPLLERYPQLKACRPGHLDRTRCIRGIRLLEPNEKPEVS